MLLTAGLLCLLSGPLLFAAEPQRQSLTFDQRLTAQTAIEQVYWRHCQWPKENPTPKPALSAVLSEQMIRDKVEDYLRKSNALERYWQRPVTPKQLQDEMDRMAAGTRAPGILKELFAALGNDPYVVAETLARQTLVDRLVRNWYANDTRFHGSLRTTAETQLTGCQTLGCVAALGGEYDETRWKLQGPGASAFGFPPRRNEVSLAPSEWQARLDNLASKLGGAPGSLPLRKPSRLEESNTAFTATEVLSQDDSTIQTATVSWSKVPFDEWWSTRSAELGTSVPDSSHPYTLPGGASATCLSDAWEPMKGAGGMPEARVDHTAVWTGTEMIVWGGRDYMRFNTGGRYNPSTDTWTATSTGANVPSGRAGHTAVWTGREMIVWGGEFTDDSGGRYDPATDRWLPTSREPGVPAARWGHTAVWTGTEMIVWGGGTGSPGTWNNGGRYNPSTDRWTPTSTGPDVPDRSGRHTAVWTGTEMIVCCGLYDNYAGNTAGRYKPSTDTWTRSSQGWNVPQTGPGHTAVWTGSELIVWGGTNPVSGSRYNPLTDSWTLVSTGPNAPDTYQEHRAVWTGSEMIIWGGRSVRDYLYLISGSRYDPSADAWSAISSGVNVPHVESGYTAVWTGSEMIVWGGQDAQVHNTGSRYDPSTDSWTPTSTEATSPGPMSNHTAVWTGTEMIVWGGGQDTGGRYSPATDVWSVTAKAPYVSTYYQTAVWTGSEMIIWGGEVNTGGRYDPSSNTWTPTSTGANVPEARTGHSAIWTGTEMIVWGGGATVCNDEFCDFPIVNTGARYDPSSDTWAPIGMGGNVPAPRVLHSAVWTGTEMVVWGGSGGFDWLNTGGRYTPSTDSWLPTSTDTGVPEGRVLHTTVWTGEEMIVWGGEGTGNPFLLNSGGRYDPFNDTWTPMSTGADVPEGRQFHTAVWNGTEMIVWGGQGVYDGSGYDRNTGGRYDPRHDTWSPTSIGDNVPEPRNAHSAVWTGTEMIVWGGVRTGQWGVTGITGGRYGGGHDADNDGLCSDVDNCPTVSNLAQADWNGDGSGDACQPLLTLRSVEHGGEDRLEVDAWARDPNGDPVTGSIEFFRVTPVEIPSLDPDAPTCEGFLPGGIPGEGIGYYASDEGSFYLYDIDSTLSCKDGLPDFWMAGGHCTRPFGEFTTIFCLYGPGCTPNFEQLCIRRYQTYSGGITLPLPTPGPGVFRTSITDDSPALRIPFSEGLPRLSDISSLAPGATYRLVITVTDGTTVPVSVATIFLDQGEREMEIATSGSPPQARIKAVGTVECTGPLGADVTLDGSASSDEDSTPGTHDDIVSLEWLILDPGSEEVLGSGDMLDVTLPLGIHTLRLKVTDSQSYSSTAEVEIAVVDTTPPALSLQAYPAILWPPNHRMVPVHVRWQLSDLCDPAPTIALSAAASSEPDDATGGGDGATSGDVAAADLGAPDSEVLLRAERVAGGGGRTYEIAYRATDASGNESRSSALVSVPHSQEDNADPLVMMLSTPDLAPAGVRIEWSAVAGATDYDLISGRQEDLTISGGQISLGPVRLLMERKSSTSWVESPPEEVPARGRAFFYLLQYHDAQGGSGYGAVSAGLPREASP